MKKLTLALVFAALSFNVAATDSVDVQRLNQSSFSQFLKMGVEGETGYNRVCGHHCTSTDAYGNCTVWSPIYCF